MGVVYRSTQLALGRPVAVKAIAPELAEDESYRERFKREAQLAASIDHPNVIPVYEAGESDGTLYLIMRWVDGTDLRALLSSSGRLVPSRAVRLLRPVAAALGAAHQRGLVHRDVKPANVLIARGDDEDEEHVYLTDFGIARRAASRSAMTSTGTFVGTVDYMAPERIIGGKGGSPSDLYSFGCMLFEALSGQLPFDRQTNVAKVFAHVNDPVPSVRAVVPEVPERLDAIVTKAMAKRPEDRFASAGALTRALGEVLDELKTEEQSIAAQTVLSDAPTEPREERATVRDDGTRTEQATAPETQQATTPATEHATAPAAGQAVAAETERATARETWVSAPTAVDDAPVTPVRRRGRAALWAAPVALLVAIGVVVAVIATGGSSPQPASSGSPAGTPGAAASASTPPSSEVTTISPGLKKLQTIALGSAPGGVAIAQAGDVLVSLPNTGAVVRISPDGSVTRLAVGSRPGLIAAGPAGVWVSNSSSGALALFDVRTGRSIATSPLTAGPTALATDPGDGSAWASDSSGNIVHVDPAGSLVGHPARVPPPITSLRRGEGWLWAVNGTASGLVRVSVDGSGSTTTFNTHPGPVDVTFDQGIWTAHSGGNITRFDPRPGFLDVNTDNPIAPSLDAIDAIEGQPSVWATSKQAQTLYRSSTQTGAPVTGTVLFASAPVALAVAGSGVWVATADGNLTQIGM
jgi:serine/threonine-protein kinase